MKKIEKSIEIAGRKISISTGHIAQQADGAVMAQMGETVAMATVVSAPLKEDPGYFPLNVNYAEKLYAGGKIKGSRWVKRDGRPTDEEILTGRLIDRSIRPLFPKNYKKDVQVAATVMSVDLENGPDMVSALAVSAALAIAPVAMNDLSVTVKIGKVDGKYMVMPTTDELSKSEMELTVSMTKAAI